MISMCGMPPPVVKRPDAQRNRATLATAEAMFAKEGLAVSVDHIAKRAKVGIGTVVQRRDSPAVSADGEVVHVSLDAPRDRRALLFDRAMPVAPEPLS